MKIEEIKPIIVLEIERMDLFPFRDVFVFGDQKNDIDIAIIISDTVDKSYVIESLSSILIKTSLEIRKLLTVTPITETEFDAAKTSFIKNIREEIGHD